MKVTYILFACATYFVSSSFAIAQAPAPRAALNLHQAAAVGDLVLIRKLLCAGACPSSKDADGDTPLDLAERYEQAAAYAIIMDKVYERNARDRKGWSAINWAVLSGDAGLVEEFLRKGYHPFSSRGINALSLAVLIRELGVLETLLKYVNNDIDASESDNNTTAGLPQRALIELLRLGDFEGAEIVLKRGAKPNLYKNYNTPLSYFIKRLDKTWRKNAQSEVNEEAVMFLLQHGAKIDAHSYAYLLELNLENLEQVVDEHYDEIKATQEEQSYPTLLMKAAAKDNLKAATMLLEKGINVKERDADGYSALYSALRGGALEVAKLLVENGADLDALLNNKWPRGKTFLHVVSPVLKDLKTYEYIFDNGADVNAQDDTGETVFTEIIGRYLNERIYAIIQVMLENGADLQETAAEGSVINKLRYIKNIREDRHYDFPPDEEIFLSLVKDLLAHGFNLEHPENIRTLQAIRENTGIKGKDIKNKLLKILESNGA